MLTSGGSVCRIGRADTSSMFSKDGSQGHREVKMPLTAKRHHDKASSHVEIKKTPENFEEQPTWLTLPRNASTPDTLQRG
jgi:hypothetical protein